MSRPDWNERFSANEYAYGTAPNSFLVEHSNQLLDPVLSIAEGEGRNAVYLAEQGLTVHGVDGSQAGLEKAQRLANDREVTISTELADLAEYVPPSDKFRSVVSIFAHLPSSIRSQLYARLTQALKAGSIFLLEAYSENQVGRGTGGPRDLDLLMTCEKVSKELSGFEPMLLQETVRDVTEGIYHTGPASVIQFVGRKKGS